VDFSLNFISTWVFCTLEVPIKSPAHLVPKKGKKPGKYFFHFYFIVVMDKLKCLALFWINW
jgi:hypothetical protein